MDKITLKSPAKVNLFLDILRKRDDGFHELATIMQEIDLCDDIVITKAFGNAIDVNVVNRKDLSGDGNIAYKAAQMFLSKIGVEASISIEITKHIPVGGGLGGGSSNAAYTLKGLNELFNNPLPDSGLMDICAKLGSDVAFFIKGGTCDCRGRGEIIQEKISSPTLYYVLWNPNVEISTKKIYDELSLCLTSNCENIDNIKNALKSGESVSALLYNKLEDVVLNQYPDLKRIKDVLKTEGALNSLVSGSGATVYGIVKTYDQAEALRTILAQQSKGRLFVAKTYNNKG